jgi:hypothetical protein
VTAVRRTSPKVVVFNLVQYLKLKMEIIYTKIKEPENAHEFHMLGSPRLACLLKKQMEELVPILSENDLIDMRTNLSIKELRQQMFENCSKDIVGRPTIDSLLGLSDAFALVNQMYVRDMDPRDQDSSHTFVSHPCIILAYYFFKLVLFRCICETPVCEGHSKKKKKGSWCIPILVA